MRQGVEHAFGIPGDFALTLYDALAQSEIEPVVMTHEPSVGFAADAYSRIRGLGRQRQPAYASLVRRLADEGF